MILQLVIIQAVTFVAIVLILRGILYRHARQTLHRLQGLYEETLQREETLKKEIDNARKSREEEIKRAREEAEKIIRQTKEESQKKAQEVLNSAEEEAAKALEKAKAQIEKLRSQLTISMEQKSVVWTESILKDIFTPRSSSKFHKELIDELVCELTTLDEAWWNNLKEAESISVISSQKIEDPIKEEIKKLFTSKAGKPVACEFKQDPSILGGLIIDVKGKVIDGSLKNKIQRALKAAQKPGS